MEGGKKTLHGHSTSLRVAPVGHHKWFRSLPGVKIDAVGVELFEWNFLTVLL